MKIPSIKTANESHDFHDSRLLHLEVDPLHDRAFAVVMTPDAGGETNEWKICLDGLLELHLITVGDGEKQEVPLPPEIFDIYEDEESPWAQGWRSRFIELDFPTKSVRCIVFASSFLRGWGKQEDIEGIRVACRRFKIEPFRGREHPGVRH